MSMHVCLVASEIFAWGKYGGFGSIVRWLARGLSDAGIDVTVVVPQRPGQRKHEILDNFKVTGHPGWMVLADSIYKEINADIYHSMEPTLATVGAWKAMPDRKHVVTSMDPWALADWWTEFRYDLQDGIKRALIYPLLWAYYSPQIVKRAVANADLVLSQSKFLISKIRQIYGLDRLPLFVPNLYPVPSIPIDKAKRPTVCYVARWDPRKRPEYFFELAKRFPDVRFIALGKAHNPQRDAKLRKRYNGISNLELVGFVNPFESKKLQQILGESWIMVNTSAREGLPAAYVEAAAHQCAILSAVDSDKFVSRGGYHVRTSSSEKLPLELGGQDASVEDYATGLEWLLEKNRWHVLGKAGFAYFEAEHSQKRVVRILGNLYRDLLDS